MDHKSQNQLLDIPEKTLARWQRIIDTLARIMNVPAALIMRLAGEDIEVFLKSDSRGNPYHPGDHEHFEGSGLYCETAIKTRKKLVVPNALTDEKWKNNPDVKLNMISYLGYPIYRPDGDPFGTICVLDSKENLFGPDFTELLYNFRYIIEEQLSLVYMNRLLGDKNSKLTDYINEIKTLRSILPVCSMCKKIRNKDGQWENMEHHIHEETGVDFSHTFCPECAVKWRREQGLE